MSKHKDRQTKRIVEATLHLIHNKGLSQVTMTNIAKAAGVTRQTIYNYFPDVESIISGALEAHSQAINQHLLDVVTSAQGLQAKVRALAEFQIGVASPEHSAVSIEAALSPQARARLTTHSTELKTVLFSAISDDRDDEATTGELDPMAACDLICEMVGAAATTAATHPDQKTVLAETVVRALRAALSDEHQMPL